MSLKKFIKLAIFCLLPAIGVGAYAEIKAETDSKEKTEKFAAVAKVNYEMVVPAQPTQSGNKIEVLEIFWYGCPHCYDFEPTLDEWLESKPDDVAFRRMPGIFRKNWVPHAKAFYAAEKLGIFDKVHMPLFDAIHNEGKTLNNDKTVLKFISSLDGVDAKAFKKAYNSFSVESKVKQATRMSRNYGIRGVPSLVINGKYYSSGSIAGTYDDLLKVVDILIEKERKRLAKK